MQQNIYSYHALERMSEAPKFNHWMYNTISPFLSGKILEIGSGIGNLSDYFVEDKKNISLSDYDNSYVLLLKEKYNNVKDIFQLDLSLQDFQNKYEHLAERYDSVFLLNVLEHISTDQEAVSNCCFLLKPGGTLLILVPAYQILFSKMDALLGHYRRYTIDSLKKVFLHNNFKIEKAFYFNVLGICGWVWNKIFNKPGISKSKIALFNKLVPLGKILDKLLFNNIGLSVIIIAKKAP